MATYLAETVWPAVVSALKRGSTVGPFTTDVIVDAAVRSRGKTAGRAGFTLAKGATRSLKVRLSKPARKRLRRHGRLRLTAAVTLTEPLTGAVTHASAGLLMRR
jgi:hypothetical protein